MSFLSHVVARMRWTIFKPFACHATEENVTVSNELQWWAPDNTLRWTEDMLLVFTVLSGSR